MGTSVAQNFKYSALENDCNVTHQNSHVCSTIYFNRNPSRTGKPKQRQAQILGLKDWSADDRDLITCRSRSFAPVFIPG